MHEEEGEMLRKVCTCLAAALCLGLTAGLGICGDSVTVYTARSNAADKEVFKDFEAASGIAVQVVEGKPEELMEEILAGGDGPRADLFMTVDGGILTDAKEQGVFAKASSPAIGAAVPEALRDGDNAWVGVTTRARVIVYAKDRVKPKELSTYFALGRPEWKGRVAVRSSGALYNQSLMASLIAAYGEEKPEQWASCLGGNLAREPQGGDRDQAKAVAAGTADVAIMNSYYIGNMLKSRDADEVAAANAVGVFFPDQDGAGTHVNICGIGVVRNAGNPGAALKLIEYLVSAPAQEKLSAGNSEFPVNPEAKKVPLLEGWGNFKTQEIDFAKIAENRELAKELLEKSGWK